jgi:hypothetical protein
LIEAKRDTSKQVDIPSKSSLTESASLIIEGAKPPSTWQVCLFLEAIIYELPYLQALCFDNYPAVPGQGGVPVGGTDRVHA